MLAAIPENDKKAGVCYAVSDDGLELPVIDLTHPAFAIDTRPAVVDALIESFQRSAAIPFSALQAAAQKSILVRGMVESAGTFTSGMMTYLNKLPADLLGAGYAGPLDRQFAASLTPFTFRWRMRDVARLLADDLAPGLAAHPSAPAALLNIAGGPAADSLNALLLLQQEQPGLLAGREITIHVLDLDPHGPSFGGRALLALLAEGAPLHGLAVRLEYTPYDWSKPASLAPVLERMAGGVCAGSSEGGLFEYGADEDIRANLAALAAGTGPDFCMVGPVVRSAATLDPRLQGSEHVPGRPAVRYLGLEHFAALARPAGWHIDGSLDSPMHQVVNLKKDGA